MTALVPIRSDNYSSNGSINRAYRTRVAWAPIVQFRHDGQLTQLSDSVASNPPAYHVGETVSVLYLESNSYDARIDSLKGWK